MTWFKVDDTLAMNGKARAAGKAMALWVMAGSHCSQQLTDGFVASWFVDTFRDGLKDAETLVACDLWHAVDGGWQFHDWERCNPTRDEVEADRVARRERTARWRARRDGDASRDTAPTRPDLYKSRQGPVDISRPVEKSVSEVIKDRPPRDEATNVVGLQAARAAIHGDAS